MPAAGARPRRGSLGSLARGHGQDTYGVGGPFIRKLTTPAEAHIAAAQ
jgi:hypothetical protein